MFQTTNQTLNLNFTTPWFHLRTMPHGAHQVFDLVLHVLIICPFWSLGYNFERIDPLQHLTPSFFRPSFLIFVKVEILQVAHASHCKTSPSGMDLWP